PASSAGDPGSTKTTTISPSGKRSASGPPRFGRSTPDQDTATDTPARSAASTSICRSSLGKGSPPRTPAPRNATSRAARPTTAVPGGSWPLRNRAPRDASVPGAGRSWVTMAAGVASSASTGEPDTSAGGPNGTVTATGGRGSTGRSSDSPRTGSTPTSRAGNV